VLAAIAVVSLQMKEGDLSPNLDNSFSERCRRLALPGTHDAGSTQSPPLQMLTSGGAEPCHPIVARILPAVQVTHSEMIAGGVEIGRDLRSPVIRIESAIPLALNVVGELQLARAPNLLTLTSHSRKVWYLLSPLRGLRDSRQMPYVSAIAAHMSKFKKKKVSYKGRGTTPLIASLEVLSQYSAPSSDALVSLPEFHDRTYFMTLT
jgi:hypothetical protein